MANLRIIASNAARRAALTASSTAGALAVTNLQVDKKSAVWRATGTTATIKGTLPASELASGVALWGNFSPTAAMRVRLTSEASTTNLLLYSQQLDGAAWSRQGALTANAATAPDGTNTAYKLTGTSTDGYIAQNYTAAAAGTFTSSIWLRADTPLDMYIYLYTSGSGWQRIAVHVDTTWQRFSVTLAGDVPTMTAQFGGGGTLANTAIYMWGAQLESGLVATSYYPTTSATATRPLGYMDDWQDYTNFGYALACPAPAIQLEGWTAAQSASAYAYGGGAWARAWFPSTQFCGFAIDLVDTNNLQGYIEAAQLIIGAYWSPTYNAISASDTLIDAATHYLTDAGDLMTQASTINKQVPIELQYMPASDRATLANILRASRAYPIFLSVFPENADLELERDYTVYGKRTSDSEVAVQMAIRYGTKLEVKSI